MVYSRCLTKHECSKCQWPSGSSGILQLTLIEYYYCVQSLCCRLWIAQWMKETLLLSSWCSHSFLCMRSLPKWEMSEMTWVRIKIKDIVKGKSEGFWAESLHTPWLLRCFLIYGIIILWKVIWTDRGEHFQGLWGKWMLPLLSPLLFSLFTHLLFPSLFTNMKCDDKRAT